VPGVGEGGEGFYIFSFDADIQNVLQSFIE